MTAAHPIDVYLKRYPGFAASLYVVILIALLVTVLLALMGIVERYRALNESVATLARLESRAAASAQADWLTGPVPPGSPFLEGQSVTVASAALLQRLTAAITRAGGNIVSSEVAQGGEETTSGYVKVIATCELQEPGLDRLLYDLEAGMPFLFVDPLTVEASLSASSDRPMRVTLGVSGLWLGAK
jgi:general secretion pathway protein M